MALSGSSNYNGTLDSTIDEQWLFEFRNQSYPDPADPQPADTSGSIIRVSTDEVTHASISDMRYHGLVLNKPSIRESIDLSTGQSSVSNISITCHNGTLENHSKTLSEEIYLSSGSRNYINRDVYVYSRIGGYTNTIFKGRLKDVKMLNGDKVSITIAVQNPLENVSIPQYTSKSGNYFPVVYGSGVPETSTNGSPDFVESAEVFPLKVDTLNNGVFNCLAHQALTDGRLHYPLKDTFNSTGLPMFTPTLQLDGTHNEDTSYDDYEGETDNTNKNVIRAGLELIRRYKLRPQTVTIEDAGANTSVTNGAYAYDSSTSTGATLAFSTDADGTDVIRYLISDLTREEHSIQVCKVYVTWQISNYQEPTGGGESLEVSLQVGAKYSGGNFQYKTVGTHEANRASTTDSLDLTSTSNFSTAINQVPEEIKVNFNFAQSVVGSGDTGTATITVTDIYFEIRTQIEDEGDEPAMNPLINSTAVNNIEKLYTGADGLTKSFSSGTVTNIVDMHRDLLSRFLGVAGSSETINVLNGSTSNAYSDLTTARSTWTCRYWTDEKEELKDLLEQCQLEGGFVFKFRPSDGTPQYIYIANSTTATHTITKDDIKNLNISITPFESLITKRELKYYKNPINDEMLKEQTSSDTTNNPRTTYNVGTKENVETTDLEILSGGVGATNMGSGNRNDGFANYYNAITGLPKMIVNTEIVNAGSSGGSSYFYLMEVGDVCAISHSNQIAAPFGTSFENKKFMVTSLTRTIGSLKVILREI